MDDYFVGVEARDQFSLFFIVPLCNPEWAIIVVSVKSTTCGTDRENNATYTPSRCVLSQSNQGVDS